MSGHFSSRKRVTPINAACAGRSVEFWDIRHIQKRCRHQGPVCLPLQLLYASTIDIVWTNDRISRDWRLHRDYRSTTDFKKYTFFFFIRSHIKRTIALQLLHPVETHKKWNKNIKNVTLYPGLFDSLSRSNKRNKSVRINHFTIKEVHFNILEASSVLINSCLLLLY